VSPKSRSPRRWCELRVTVEQLVFAPRNEVEDVRPDLGRDRLHPLREWERNFECRKDRAWGLSRDSVCVLVVRVLAPNVGLGIDLRG
jgi:hypothetical protein